MNSGKVRVCGGTRGSDTGIEDERYDGQEEVDVEEGGDFLSACYALVQARGYTQECAHLPTAVNFERTWIIITTVITMAKMCMKSLAASKMRVFAISIVRA